MADIRIKRALIAVYDKTGIAEFARALVDEFDIEIISTGGTAKHLKDAGIPVTMVEEVTGFPELLDGRVKTLHPKIHAAILADRSKPEHMEQLAAHNIQPLDMVVVNLYPFAQTIAKPDCRFEDAIEMIDIGGPCMLRAAAKNHSGVLVVPSTSDYSRILEMLRANQGRSTLEERFLGAQNTFFWTNYYDLEVNNYLAHEAMRRREEPSLYPMPAALHLHGEDRLRYGDNPFQKASIWHIDRMVGFETEAPMTFDECDIVMPGLGCYGGEMSFNNYVDGDAALSLIKELTRAPLSGKHAVAFIKHTNACGCAIGDDPIDVYRRAYLGDPIAAAGGVLCVNFPVTRDIADTVMNSFSKWGKAAGAAFFKLDVWIAPHFDKDAIELITTPTEKRKWGAECRLISPGRMDTPPDPNDLDYKKITGGILIQTRDLLGLNEDQWKVVTKRTPTESEISDLRLAWLICKHTKSNAITICRDGMLIGNGAGQMSRVKSCDLAIQLARESGHGDKLKGAVAAGDAFFPVPDGPQKLIDAGITAIIHPGGSNRDAETVTACDAANVAMIVTGTRHFKH